MNKVTKEIIIRTAKEYSARNYGGNKELAAASFETFIDACELLTRFNKSIDHASYSELFWKSKEHIEFRDQEEDTYQNV